MIADKQLLTEGNKRNGRRLTEVHEDIWGDAYIYYPIVATVL